jgi:hypothetical protein
MKTLNYDGKNPKKAMCDLKAALLADSIMDEIEARFGTDQTADGLKENIEMALSLKIWEMGI